MAVAKGGASRAAGSLADHRRRRARRGEGDKLRAEILEAAERLLMQTADEGGVSIRAVAEMVGVTPPSIYLHFADKEELLLAVCEKNFVELNRRLQEAAAGSGDPLESLRRAGRAYVRFGLDHPEEYRILFMRKPRAATPGLEHERLRSSSGFDDLVRVVEACMDGGVIRRQDSYLVSLGLWSVVHGITSLLISKPTFPWPPLDDLVDHILGSQLEGLRSDAGR